MRALTIRQPWAWLIANGYKDIENRSRKTTHRGPILIHASTKLSVSSYEEAVRMLNGTLAGWHTELRDLNIVLPSYSELARGGVIGMAEITDCVSSSPSPWFTGQGDFGWTLKNGRTLPFLPYKGQLTTFEIPDELLNL